MRLNGSVHCSSQYCVGEVKRHTEGIDVDHGGHTLAIDARRPLWMVVAEPLVDGADGDVFAFALQQLSGRAAMRGEEVTIETVRGLPGSGNRSRM